MRQHDGAHTKELFSRKKEENLGLSLSRSKKFHSAAMKRTRNVSNNGRKSARSDCLCLDFDVFRRLERAMSINAPSWREASNSYCRTPKTIDRGWIWEKSCGVLRNANVKVPHVNYLT